MRALAAAAILLLASAAAGQIGVGLSLPSIAMRQRGASGTVEPPPYTPSLDFSDARTPYASLIF